MFDVNVFVDGLFVFYFFS